MTWVAVAIGGAALVGAGASVYASNQQASGQQAAQQTAQNEFNTINKQEQPFITAGTGATNKLSDLLGTSGNNGAAGYGSLTSNFTPADLNSNLAPSYNFMLQQGDNALMNSAAATTGALSGPALKNLINYNQNYASTGYQQAFNNWNTQQNNIFQRLTNLATLGQNAASTTGAQGTQLAGQVGAAQVGAANAQAGGTVGVAGSLVNGLNNAAGYYSLNGLNNPTQTGATSPLSPSNGGSTYTDPTTGYISNVPGGGS